MDVVVTNLDGSSVSLAGRPDLRDAGVRGGQRAGGRGVHALPRHPGHHPPERGCGRVRLQRRRLAGRLRDHRAGHRQPGAAGRPRERPVPQQRRRHLHRRGRPGGRDRPRRQGQRGLRRRLRQRRRPGPVRGQLGRQQALPERRRRQDGPSPTWPNRRAWPTPTRPTAPWAAPGATTTGTGGSTSSWCGTSTSPTPTPSPSASTTWTCGPWPCSTTTGRHIHRGHRPAGGHAQPGAGGGRLRPRLGRRLPARLAGLRQRRRP